jgi:ferredoxin-nitrate reductase
MGGREVGYLSNGLPGYRDVRNSNDRASCEEYWTLPINTISPTPGITITDAIDAIVRDEIRFMWVACTNPLLTLSDVQKTQNALVGEALFLVVQDCVLSETALLANLVLPTFGWGEKEGSMTNSERFIKRVRPFKSPPLNTKSDSDIICAVAQKLGFEGFNYPNMHAIYDEYKQLTQGRLCDQSCQEYETLAYQWGGATLYADEHFATVTQKAQFHPIHASIVPMKRDHFVLITGRTKKQWHTMTRTGTIPELLKGEEEPYLVMNHEEAYSMKIHEGDHVTISNELGSLTLPVRFGILAQRHLFAPFGYPKSPINTLISVVNDPLSFQSALKSAQVQCQLSPL